MRPPRLRSFSRVRHDVMDLVERFNLRRAWYWLGLSTLVGLVGGAGALVFQWATEGLMELFWVRLIQWTPPTAGGEPLPFSAEGPPVPWALILAPALGGLVSAFLVYRFAPEAEGHGTDAAIRAYHRERGRIPLRIPVVKLMASAFTLASGGSAGREGPIAQIGAGFGSLLGGWLRLSDKERRVLLAAGIAAGIGAIFRAPLAGAVFAAEVLYREPDIEAEVVVPALLSSIVSYSLYCSVHGFGHLLTGTDAFVYERPLALVAYLVLGGVVAFGSIGYVKLFDRTTRFFRGLKISNYLKPVIGAALTGLVGLLAWALTRDLSALAVMGSGYGILQSAVAATGDLGPSVAVLAVVALGKMVTTSLTIGSGGSGGVFGPSMVIGGTLGALVGVAFHAWLPDVVPNIGPFTVVGMAGFFAGVANTPISTLLMVGDITGNYSLLLPAMMVVGMALIVAHRWTIYPEQVSTRASSPAHRGEFLQDVLSDLKVGAVYDPERSLRTVAPHTPLNEVMRLITATTQQYFPVLDGGKLVAIFSLNDVREVLYEEGIGGLVLVEDIANRQVVTVETEDTLQRALGLLTIRNLDEVPVVDDDGHLLGVLTRRDIIAAYNHRLVELKGETGGELPVSDRL